jgi:protein TonB
MDSYLTFNFTAMSKLSIFETKWIDLVFENRNKEYGAYQLRQENPRTTMKALLITTTFLAVVVAIPKFSKTNAAPVTPEITLLEAKRVTEVIYAKKTEQPKKPKTTTVAAAKKSNPKRQDQLVNPVVTETQKAQPDIAINATITNTPNNAGENPGAPQGNPNGNSGGGGPDTTGTGPEVIQPGPFGPGELDVNPSFPGGINAFLSYVGKNFRTPEVELDRTMKVFVSFVVEKDGSLTDIKVIKDPGYGLGAEAIRVLKSLKTKWQPGKKNGKAVRAYYNLPITVQTQ